MGLYSRNRGKRGERLWCAFCREQGYDVHRTAQYREWEAGRSKES